MSGLHADFSGRRALVTGGTKGIGRATALLVARLDDDGDLPDILVREVCDRLVRACVEAGIRVNGLVLGWFDTEGERTFCSAEQIARQAAQNIPAGRAGAPAEAARMVAVLASPLSSYATGSLVRLDGGFALAPDVLT